MTAEPTSVGPPGKRSRPPARSSRHCCRTDRRRRERAGSSRSARPGGSPTAHLHRRDALGILRIGLRRVDPILVDRAPERIHAASIHGSELALDPGIVDEEEAPPLRVSAARRADRRVQDLLLDPFRDRVGLHAAHRARGVEGFHCVHEGTPGLGSCRKIRTRRRIGDRRPGEKALRRRTRLTPAMTGVTITAPPPPGTGRRRTPQRMRGDQEVPWPILHGRDAPGRSPPCCPCSSQAARSSDRAAQVSPPSTVTVSAESEVAPDALGRGWLDFIEGLEGARGAIENPAFFREPTDRNLARATATCSATSPGSSRPRPSAIPISPISSARSACSRSGRSTTPTRCTSPRRSTRRASTGSVGGPSTRRSGGPASADEAASARRASSSSRRRLPSSARPASSPR